MAIRSVTELFDGRDGTLSTGLERRYVRKFRVRTDSKYDGPVEIMFAAGIPRLYDAYRSFGTSEVDAFALCTRVSPTQDSNDWSTWVVECEYSTDVGLGGPPDDPGQPGAGGGSGSSGDPTLDPPVIEWGSQTREVALPLDLGDPDAADPVLQKPRPFLNSAGQPFDPPPTIEVSHLTLTVERNEPTFNASRALRYRNTVNADLWQDRLPGRWWCRQITGHIVFKGPYRYARVRYEFWLSPSPLKKDLWDNLLLLDQGLCRLGPDGKNPVPIERNGHPISQPVLLKGGLPLSKDDILNPAIGPQYLTFKRYRREPFAPLNITI